MLTRATAALALALTFAFAPPAAAQDLPGPSPNLELIPAGSLVIPMDNAHQTLVAPFNLKAYGLVNTLLQNKIPVKWAIKAGKAKDGIDFTATASQIKPSVGSSGSVDFKAGPFIIHKAYASAALPLITAFGSNVVVYQITSDVTVDVRYTLTFKPKVAVNATNSTIHTGILDAAGITNYDVISDFGLLAGSCYTLACEPHNTSTTGIAAIHNYVLTGGNFIAQCHSVDTYENNTPGGYMSTAGLTIANTNNAITYPNPDLSFSQFEGTLEPSPGGSLQDVKLSAGSVLQTNAHIHGNDAGTAVPTWAAMAQKMYFSGYGGMVFYLGGHSYSNANLGMINGQRMFLNAVMTPPTRPSSCNLSFGIPDLAITKTHSGTFYVGGNRSYTIGVTNVGADSTLGAVTVTDTLPSGLTYVSAAGTGWSFSVSGQIVTGTYAARLPSAGAASFTLTVAVGAGASPSVTNRARCSTSGDVNAANDVASDPTTVVIPVDLSLQKRHTAVFTDRSNGTYTLVVRNVGPFATQGATTVLDTLPAGLTYVSAAGAGWSFSNSGQIVTATFAGTIAVSDSAKFTLTAAAGATAVPSVTNAATVSTVNDTGAVNDRATDPTTVNGVVDLRLQKRHTADFSGLSAGVYTLVATNTGSQATTGTITVTDTLPTGLTYGSAAGGGWSFSHSGQVVTATHPGPIAAQDSLKFTLSVTVGGAAVPSVTNTAVVATPGDVDASNDRAVDPTVVSGVPDLSLGKRHAGPFAVGQNGVYTLSVVNVSAGPTPGAITVRDTLPAGLGYVSSAGAGWTVSASGQVITATNPGPIAAGDSSVFTLTVSVGAAAVPSVVNAATVSTPGDLFPANDRATDATVVDSPDLSLDKRHTTAFTVGQNGTYTMVVRNLGGAATSGATTVRDTLPAGLAFVSAAGAGWSVSNSGQIVTATLAGTIAAGDSSLFTLTTAVAPAAFPSVTNAATVTTANDLLAADDRDLDPTAITGVPDLTLDKRHTAAFTVGQNGVYTLVVHNAGTGATSAATTVRDTLPAGLAFVSAAGAGWSVANSGQVVTATFAGAIAAGDSSQFTLTAAVAPAAFPSVTNAATASATGDLDPSNDRGSDPTAVTGAPDLSLDKRHTAAFTVGQNGVYTLVVHNAGTAATSGATTVRDTLPAGLAFVSAAGAGWSFSTAGQIVTATFAGVIAAGDSGQFTLTAAVTPAAFPSVTNAATASTANDVDPSDDRDVDPTAITGVPDLTLDKRHTAAFTVGQNGVYTLVVRNAGTGATSGATTVRDTLPAGLTFVSAAGAGWSVSNSGPVVTATFAGSIAAGDSSLFTLTASVTPAAFPSVTNAATVSTADDLDPVNDRDTDPTAIGGVPDLTLDKRHTAAFTLGLNGTYTLVVRNAGTAATAGATTVRDTLPAALAYVTAAGAGWSFSTAGQIVTATFAGSIAAGDSSLFTLTVLPGPGAIPSVTNAASVATAGDVSPGNDRDVDPTTVNGTLDLQLEKRHTGRFEVGTNDTYTLVVTNVGTGAFAGGCTVRDTLPAGLSFVSGAGAGWSFSTSGQVVTADFAAALAGGDSATFTLTVGVAFAAFPATVNTAAVTGAGDLNAANDRAVDSTRVHARPDLALDKRHTAAFVDGQDGVWTFVATNVSNGPTTAAVTVTDTLPAGTAFVSGAGAGWSVSASGAIVTATHAGVIAPGDSAVFALTVSVGAAAVPLVTNSATLSGGGDLDPSDDRDTDPTAVTPAPDVTLDKRHTAAFAVGQDGTYTLVVRNLGTAPTAGAVTVRDTLPAGLSFVSAAGAGWSFSTSGTIVTATFPAVIATGDSSRFTLTVAVAPGAYPSVTNAASATTPNDRDASDDRDLDPTGVTGVPDLTLDKRHTTAFTVGQDGDYTLVVRNLGTGATTGATTVTDVLPAGLSFVAAAGTGWSVSAIGPTVTATHAAAIAAGDSAAFTLTVAVAAAAFPSVTNTATATTPGDLDAGNDGDADPTAVTGAPDLALDKRHTTAFTVGQGGDYTLVVRNLGTGATVGATTVVDTLPAGLSFVAASGAGFTFLTSGPIVAGTDPDPIAPGDSLTITLTVAVAAAAFPAVTNTAHVTTSGDPQPANDTDSDLTPIGGAPDLALDKRHTAAFAVGQNGTYTLVVRNVGTAVTNAATTVTDTIPAGLALISASGSGFGFAVQGPVLIGTYPAAIPPGDSVSFTVLVGVTPAAFPTVTNAAVAATLGDPVSANDRDVDPTAIGGVPDLALDKRHTAAFVVGQDGTYTLVAHNLGSAATTGPTTVTDVLPAGLTFVSATGAGWSLSTSGATVTATHAGLIAAGDSAGFTLTASVGAAAFPSVTNQATASTPGDLDASNDVGSDLTEVSGVADIALDKRHTAALTVGQDAVYTLVLHNTGTAATTGAVTVRDTLPAGLGFVSAAGPGFSVSNAGAIVTALYAGALAAGDSAALTLTVLVDAAAFPSVTNAATAEYPGDLVPDDNRDVDPAAVDGVPDLSLDKRHTAPFIVGQDGAYTLVIRNLGTAATVSATTVTDTLPAGLTYVSASGSGFAFAHSGPVVTATYAGALAAGDSAQFTLTVAVDPTAFPSVTNAATVATTGDLSPANDRDTDPTAIGGLPDLALTKRHVGEFTVAQAGDYALTVTNVGTAATTGTTTVRDTLPAGLAFVAAAGSGWSFAVSGPVVTAQHAGALAAGDSAGFTVTVAVGPAAFPTVLNAASVATPGDVNGANDRSVDSADIGGVPELALAKRHAAAFVDGQPGAWTLVVTNRGTAATTGATTVVDTLPTGIGFVSGSGAGWSISAAGAIVTASFAGAIAPQDSAVFVLDVSVAAAAMPSVINAAVVATPGDPDPADDRAVDPTVVNGSHDLAILKRHSGPFEVGSHDTYTLVVVNVGSAVMASGITVADTLPAGLTFVSASGPGFTFLTSGQVVSGTDPDPLAPGDSLAITLTVAVGAAAYPLVTNTAVVATPGDVNPADDRAVDPTTVHRHPDLALDKRHTASFTQGQPGAWTIVLTNLGNGPTVGTLTVTDTLPAGVGFVSGAGTGWSFATSGPVVTATTGDPVAADDSTSFALVVSVGAAAVPRVVNRATVTVAGDPVAANDTDADSVAVTGRPDAALDKRHVAPFTVGQNGDYRLVVTNPGTAATLGTVTVVDTLPAGLTFVAASGSGWTFATAGAIVTASHAGIIAPADSAAFTLTVAVGAAAVPQAVNAATVTATGDGNPANDRDVDPTAVAGVPDLALDKRHTVAFTHGGIGAWELVVTNVGSTATSGAATVTDTLPAGIALAATSGTGWSFAQSGSIVTATHAAAIAAGDSASFTLTVSIGAAAVPGVVNSATVNTPGDVNVANDRDLDPTPVAPAPDLSLDKRHTAPFVVGQPGAYTLVVTNLGSTATTAATTVTDTLPAGLAFASAAGSGWSVVAAGGIVTATHAAAIAAGDSAAFTLDVSVGVGALGGVVNAATVVTAGDFDAANDRDTDPTAVGGVPDLALDKRHTVPFVVGQPGAYALVVTNLGSAATTAVTTVTDTLPAGLAFASAAGSGWSVVAAGGIVTATHAAAIAAGDSAAFTLDVSVGVGALGGVVNAATVATAGDFDAANDRDTDPTAVGGAPDLSLDKRHTAPFLVGQDGTYTLVVTNLGSTATTAATTVTDTLPAGLAFASAAGSGWSVVAAGGIVTATHAAAIAAGDSAAFTLDVSVGVGALGGVVNAATVATAGDFDAANDRDTDPTAVAGVPDLALDKRHIGALVVGQPAAYAFVVTNLGTAASTGSIAVTDTLPAGLTYVSGAGPGWSFTASGAIVTATSTTPIAPADSSVLSIAVAVDAAAYPSVVNSASVSGGGDSAPANDRDTDAAAVSAPDLSVDLRHTANFTVGQTGLFTVAVRNLGGAATSAATTVVDSLPAGLAFSSGSGAGWTFGVSGAVVTATYAGTIAASDSAVFGLTVAVGAAAIPSVTDRATVSTAHDLNPANDADADPVAVSGLPAVTIDKRHLADFTVGRDGQYEIVVANVGTAPTLGATTVTDSLPAGLGFVAGNGFNWTFSSSGTVVTAVFHGTMAPGDSAAFTLTVGVGPAAFPSVTNSATVSTAGVADFSGNRDSDPTVVSGQGLLTVEKAASTAQAEIGDAVDYTITVRNVGTAPVTSLIVADALPKGLRYQSGTARVDGVAIPDPAGAPGPQLTFALAPLAAGATTQVTYRVTVGAGADLGTGVNLASAGGDGGSGPLSAQSNVAAARIAVRGGVFGDQGIIVGKVYTACDCGSDRVQGPEEIGVPGVRVYLEDGSFAITDVEGKYHFANVRPRLHVVRVDAATLPAGARMVAMNTRQAQDGLSMFVDLTKGELARVDFVEGSRDSAVRAEVQARRARGETVDPADPGTGMGGAATATAADARRAAHSLLALGVIEARLAHRSRTSASLDGQRDRFGDDLKNLAFETDQGRLSGGGRGALFLKGALADSIYLTLRYDSERDPERRLFSDLRPFEGYDVLGDASVHGWEAQSAGRFYARADRGRSSALIGDFTTPASDGRMLGAFTRSLNGGLAQVAAGPLGLHAWASQGRQHQVLDEFPAQGISGPYTLSRSDGTLGSETVEVLTRDRNQPTRVLRRDGKLRFVDYTLEPFTGRLLFRQPVPSVDADLNPVSIRVTYEVESGGSEFWVYGADARASIADKVGLGVAVSRDEDPLTPRSVVSANGTIVPFAGMTLTAELAHSDSGGTIGSGDRKGEAARVELTFSGSHLVANVHALHVATGFENPSSGVTPGREELGLTAHAQLGGSATVFVNALRSKALDTGGHRDGIEAGVSRSLADRLTGEIAYRWAREAGAPASPVTAPVVPIEDQSVRGKLTATLIKRWQTTAFGELEQDLTVRDQRRFAVGGETRLTGRTRAYLRHENIASFAGPFALNSQQQQATTVFGLSSSGQGDAQVFSEYRVRDAIAGREAQAAIGLRDRWQVGDGVHLDGAFEHVTVLKGGGAASTALAGGIDYTGDPLWRGTARLELRRQASVNRWLGSAGLTRKLNRDWAALGRTTWLAVPDESRVDERSQIGLAYRQTDRNTWDALARWENRLERAGGTDAYRRMANIVSAHANAQAGGPLTLSGQVAAKWADDERAGLVSHTTGQLVAGRVLLDVTRRLDLGMSARALRAGSRTYGLGAEWGWLAVRNLRLAAGYNVFGFRDPDLTGSEPTDHGPYLDLGWKFGETLLDRDATGGGSR